MDDAPQVWVLHGARTGDNAQASQLAEALGPGFVVKQLRYGPLHRLPNWLAGAGLASLTQEARALIIPPWPKLVIAAGKRSVPAARYIRRASGGRTRLVHIGRPRAALDGFDLVITTPQYGLPAARNVAELALPFATRKPVAEAELARWQAAWTDLPRPWIAVAVGAGKYPQRLGPAELKDLADRLSSCAAEAGGSLLVMASPRTSAAAMAALQARIRGPAKFYPWAPDANPYQSALALADRIAVTSDSMSMLSEAISTGKPVSVFRLPVMPLAPRWQAKSGPMAWLARKGLLTPPRDMKRATDRLIAEGHAHELGRKAPPQAIPAPGYAAVIARVRGLLDA